MTRSPHRFAAGHVLVLLAASYVAFTISVAGHTLPGPAFRVADEAGSSSSSTPTPAHDENGCPLCLAGSRTLATGPAELGARLQLDTAPAPRLVGAAARPSPAASPEAARAPPYDLFG